MKVSELFEAANQKAWRPQVRKDYGADVSFWNDDVHKRANGTDEVTYKGKNYIRSGPKNATSQPGKLRETVKEGIAKGSWKIQNLLGVMKTFKDPEQDDARAWIKNRGDASQIWDKTTGRWIMDPKKQEREDRKADRETAKLDRLDRAAEKAKQPNVDLQKVYNIVIDAIGNSFPDGDPIDYFSGPLRRMGVPEYEVMDYANKAMKKFGSNTEKKGVYAYLAQMWDDMAGDAMYDAKNGHEARSPFVEIEDGKPVKQDNPWK